MSRSVVSYTALSLVLAAGVLGVIAAPASATSSIRSAFTARYPTSTLLTRTATATGSSCYACHQPSDTANPGNCYKEALAARIAVGRTSAQAIVDVELLDSDGDGTTNLAEITAVRTDLPGQVGYNPGLVGATGVDPCADIPTTVVTNQRETPLPLPLACNIADITQVGGTADAPGSPDNQLTVDDIIVFVNLFSDGTGCPGAAPCSRADVCGVGGPPQPPEGELTVDDVIGFFNAFSDGC